ncbi:hypothetical protein Tcan_12233 [Toxocara canis]|uniref:Uncharacterized protein n=1 Tax=Toxocara canis TaxID=6265 RepID=A0A0B2VSU9_TOXCA|nr:hypothetical protein Tcan_12233 [Toxocara canis]
MVEKEPALNALLFVVRNLTQAESSSSGESATERNANDKNVRTRGTDDSRTVKDINDNIDLNKNVTNKVMLQMNASIKSNYS